MNKICAKNDLIKIAIRLKPTQNLQIQKFIKVKKNQNVLEILDPCIFIDKSQDFSSFIPSKFYFDEVFEVNCTQQQIFENFISQHVQKFLQGENQCIFAYGPTGSGKTYSILGDLKQKQYGLTLMSLKQILKLVKTQQKIMVSYFQIYNEKIYDLLNNNEQNLKIQKINGLVEIQGLKEFQIKNFKEAIQIIKTFDKNRIVHKTDYNEVSSRSHSIFRIKLSNDNNNNFSKIMFVDLAGSERLKNINIQGNRLKECQNINQSLACLGKVVQSLTKKQKPNYIPFRESKLTKVLEDCFLQNNKISFLFTIQSLDQNYHEILSTLRFAKKVKKIKINNRNQQNLIESSTNCMNQINVQKQQKVNIIKESDIEDFHQDLQQKDDIINQLTKEIENYEDIFFEQEEEIQNLKNQQQLQQQEEPCPKNLTIQQSYSFQQERNIRKQQPYNIMEFKMDIDKIIYELSQKNDNYKINLLAHDLLMLQRKIANECQNKPKKNKYCHSFSQKENTFNINKSIFKYKLDKVNNKKIIQKKFKVSPL